MGPRIGLDDLGKIILLLSKLDASDHPVCRLISIMTTLSQLIIFFRGIIYGGEESCAQGFGGEA